MSKKKIDNGQPCVIAKCNESSHRIWALRLGDTVSTNLSGNYDHKSRGPGLFMESEAAHGTNSFEGYVNDPAIWTWINQMVNLGLRWIEENPDADTWAIRKEISDELEAAPKRNGRVAK